MFRHDPAHTGFSTSSNHVDSSPAVVNGRVYVGSSNGNVYCLDASTGTQIWVNFKIQDDVYSSPAVVSGRVYVGSLDGKVYCLDSQTGEEIWSYTTEDWIRSSPAVVNGYLYISSADGNIYCLDAQTGAKIWNYTTDFVMNPSSAVADGYVYFGSNDANIHCLDANNGALVWNYLTGAYESSPAVVNGFVYVGGYSIFAFGEPSTVPTSDSIPLLTIIEVATVLITTILVVAFLVYRKKRKGKQTAPSHTFWTGKLNKRLLLLIVVALITVVTASSFVVLYHDDSPAPSEPSQPNEPPPVLWQRSIDNFATDLAVADGKVYVPDNWGNVFCFESQNGKPVWTSRLGSYMAGGSKVAVYERKVYVGGSGSVVNKLDERTGNLELTFQAPTTSSYGSKSSPDFFVADGRVFASQNGMAVYDAGSGELFWEYSSYLDSITLGDASASAPESDYVLIRGTSRINLNNGSTLWRVGGWHTEPPVISQGQVILWNYDAFERDVGQNVLSVNASSGDTLWSFDAGASIFQPTVYNGLLLFGASDGNFYALHMTNGTVAWKTHVDTQNIMAGENLPVEVKFDSPPAVSLS